jgi:hypothetical protein
MADHYAWSNIYLGGEVEDIETFRGTRERIVTKRNIVPAGEKVTQAKLKMEKEQWEALIEGGSVRPYPLPEGADEVTSPTEAVMKMYLTPSGRGEIDQNMLLELALTQPLPEPEEAQEAAKPQVPKGA